MNRRQHHTSSLKSVIFLLLVVGTVSEKGNLRGDDLQQLVLEGPAEEQFVIEPPEVRDPEELTVEEYSEIAYGTDHNDRNNILHSFVQGSGWDDNNVQDFNDAYYGKENDNDNDIDNYNSNRGDTIGGDSSTNIEQAMEKTTAATASWNDSVAISSPSSVVSSPNMDRTAVSESLGTFAEENGNGPAKEQTVGVGRNAVLYVVIILILLANLILAVAGGSAFLQRRKSKEIEQLVLDAQNPKPTFDVTKYKTPFQLSTPTTGLRACRGKVDNNSRPLDGIYLEDPEEKTSDAVDTVRLPVARINEKGEAYLVFVPTDRDID